MNLLPLMHRVNRNSLRNTHDLHALRTGTAQALSRSMMTMKESAATRWKLPRTPYSWTGADTVGGIMLGDGTFAAVGSIAYEDQAFAGYGRMVRIVAASTLTDGSCTWVTIRPLDERTGLPRSKYSTEDRVLYSPDHLWRTQDLATHASKERAQGNHRIGWMGAVS